MICVVTIQIDEIERGKQQTDRHKWLIVERGGWGGNDFSKHQSIIRMCLKNYCLLEFSNAIGKFMLNTFRCSYFSHWHCLTCLMLLHIFLFVFIHFFALTPHLAILLFIKKKSFSCIFPQWHIFCGFFTMSIFVFIFHIFCALFLIYLFFRELFR